MKKLSLLLFFFSLAAFSQEKYILNPNLPVMTVQDVLKHADSIFLPRITVTFAYTSDHLKPYSEIQPEAGASPDYLPQMLEKIKKDSLNPYHYSTLAFYYSNMGNAAQSQEYYGKAYNKLKHFKIGKDSASYYSYSGYIKLHLGQEGIQDVEKALSINAADSLAFVFYPMMLINNGRFNDAKRVLKPLLEYDAFKYQAYLYLGMVEVYEMVQQQTQTGKDWVEVSKGVDIATIVNMEPYERSFSKSDKFFRLQQEISRLFNCFMKLSPAADPKNNIPLSKKDLAYLDQRIDFFTKYLKEKHANKYNAYMCLATASWLKKDFDQAIALYEKALKVFPEGRENFSFRTLDAYNGLITLYLIRNDYNNAIAVSLRKLNAKLLDDTEKAATLFMLGKMYYANGNEEKALEYATLAAQAQETFNEVLFLAYMQARANKNIEAQKNGEKAQQLATDPTTVCDFVSYHVIVQLANGDYDTAVSLYQEGSAYFGDNCILCNYLIDHYLVEKKQ